jgi:phospholipid/cholesterol/gamma-HCH transport system substrate-binding protein
MNEERRERVVQLRVGVFVLAALVAFVGMIYALGARARLFEARYTIHADFAEVGGLTEGATIRLAGVQIGRVTGVHLPAAPGGKVRIDLTIAHRYADRIRRDSAARIETQGLLGDKLVEITVGTAGAPPVEPGEAIAARDPVDLTQIISGGGETVRAVATLAESLRQTAAAFNQAKVVQDVAAATHSARRATEQLARITTEVQTGRGWAHALVYEEPVALRRLNQILATTQAMLDRVERGQGAVGVLTSDDATRSARRFVAAMDRVGRLAERASEADGLLPTLLFDSQYRGVVDDLRVVARNFRDVSERVAGGRGTLGALITDGADQGNLRAVLQDMQVTVANLKAITARINEGEGTLGALVADPTIYERLTAILDGAERSWLLRSLIRNLGRERDGKE